MPADVSTPKGRNLTVMRVQADQILDLRHRVLRAGMPIDSARFQGDDSPDTVHLAGVQVTEGVIGGPICCVSFFRSSLENEEAMQLRGMARDPNFKGQGHGAYLLRWAEHYIVKIHEIRLFWCNARVDYEKFYEGCGWHSISHPFMIPEMPEIGLHVKMKKRI